MFRSIFANIPDVTKNLLILNVLFFLAKMVFAGQGIDLDQKLGMHYPSSPYFEPYQIITHFFMHGDLFHLLFNMIGLVVIGSHLERVWGKKRYIIFYFITALGAVLLHEAVHGYEIYKLTGELFPTIRYGTFGADEMDLYAMNSQLQIHYLIPTVGASGAIYGLLAAFALLFPNTEFMLLFPPIPIKAKWLALILAGIAIYSGYRNSGDSIAHFAHLGGMIFGFILVQIWKRKSDSFY